MPVNISSKTIKTEFIQKLGELSGQNVHQCFQCGTCTGSCPMVNHMDVPPRKVMHMAQLGLDERLADLKACWVCASCYTCTARCPRGIDIARVMEALRLITLRKNKNYIEPSQLPVETVKECPQIAMVAGFRKFTS